MSKMDGRVYEACRDSMMIGLASLSILNSISIVSRPICRSSLRLAAVAAFKLQYATFPTKFKWDYRVIGA